MEDGAIRILLAVIGGIVASLVAAFIEGTVGRLTPLPLIVMGVTIAIILLLTLTRFQKDTADSGEELLQQLDHHRRELYRLTARRQRKGGLTAAEANAWFRNKRAVARVRQQLQKRGVGYPADTVDTAPPPPMSLPTRTREFFRQPAVSLFVLLFLVSAALAYPLSAAAHSLMKGFLPGPGGVVAQLPSDAGAAATDLPESDTPTPTETPAATTTTEVIEATATPAATETPAAATLTVTSSPSATLTATAEPAGTATATAMPTMTTTAAPTATPTPTETPAATTPAGTAAAANSPTPPGAAPATPTPTFVPVGTLPAECSEDHWEVEANDSFDTAQGPLALGATYCGYLDDEYDFYFVEAPGPGRLTVALQNREITPGRPPLNLLKLFTGRRAPIDWCCLNWRDRIELTIDVHTGRYYILVDVRETVGLPYTLTTRYEAGTP